MISAFTWFCNFLFEICIEILVFLKILTTARCLGRLRPVCSICNKSTRHHRYLTLSNAIKESTIEEMYRIIQSRDWSRINEFHEYHPAMNSVASYAITGPHPGGVLLICNDLGCTTLPDEVETEVILTECELDELKAAVPQLEWKLF